MKTFRHFFVHRFQFLNSSLLVLIILAAASANPVARTSTSGALTSHLHAILQQAGKQDLRKLSQEASIEQELAGAEARSYGVSLSAGQYLRVAVVQKGIDVLASCLGRMADSSAK